MFCLARYIILFAHSCRDAVVRLAVTADKSSLGLACRMRYQYILSIPVPMFECHARAFLYRILLFFHLPSPFVSSILISVPPALTAIPHAVAKPRNDLALVGIM